MLDNTITIVRITQILKDEGWNIIDEGHRIHATHHEGLGEKITFSSNEEFEIWLTKKAVEYNII